MIVRLIIATIIFQAVLGETVETLNPSYDPIATAEIAGEVLLQKSKEVRVSPSKDTLLTQASPSKDTLLTQASPSKDGLLDSKADLDAPLKPKLEMRSADLEAHLSAEGTWLLAFFGTDGYQGGPDCVPSDRVAARRTNIGLLATVTDCIRSNYTLVGDVAPLTAKGFKATTSLCCPVDMEAWFTRLLASINLRVCSKPHIQGLMHWFTCVPDMDFQYILDIIANGNPCKYWAPTGKACPALSVECQGRHCTPLPVEPEEEEPEVVEPDTTYSEQPEDDSDQPFEPTDTADQPDDAASIAASTPDEREPPMQRVVVPDPPVTIPPTTTTPLTECNQDVPLQFWNSMVFHSNLNNRGPHNGTEGIRVANLGEYMGKQFDMTIESVSERYTSDWAHWNGVYGYFGYLTTNTGEGMDLRFTIVESGTTTPLVLPKFYFSFFDLDTANPDVSDYPRKGAEIVTVSPGFYEYHVGSDTELEIFENEQGQTVFRAQVFGDSWDNPSDPGNMTFEQQNRAITLEFRDTASFEASYDVLKGGIGYAREVYFAGKSDLAELPCQLDIRATGNQR